MSAFKQMYIFLEEKEDIWLIELAELEKEINERHEENMTRLSEEISYFSDLIEDMMEKCQQLPAEFLQVSFQTKMPHRCQAGPRLHALPSHIHRSMHIASTLTISSLD